MPCDDFQFWLAVHLPLLFYMWLSSILAETWGFLLTFSRHEGLQFASMLDLQLFICVNGAVSLPAFCECLIFTHPSVEVAKNLKKQFVSPLSHKHAKMFGNGCSHNLSTYRFHENGNSIFTCEMKHLMLVHRIISVLFFPHLFVGRVRHHTYSLISQSALA